MVGFVSRWVDVQTNMTDSDKYHRHDLFTLPLCSLFFFWIYFFPTVLVSHVATLYSPPLLVVWVLYKRYASNGSDTNASAFVRASSESVLKFIGLFVFLLIALVTTASVPSRLMWISLIASVSFNAINCSCMSHAHSSEVCSVEPSWGCRRIKWWLL